MVPASSVRLRAAVLSGGCRRKWVSVPEEIKADRPVADRCEIRVFVSSTFHDMQEEREELIKQIFPQLRQLCESRGVTWGEVDLRWGVPDEAKAEGKVLPLCLQKIEHCRPYFIGLLGERYGWVPEEISPELLETQAWPAQHCGKSVSRRAVSASEDKTLKVGDLETGAEIATITCDGNAIFCAVIDAVRMVGGDQMGRLHWLGLVE
jgi:hypothetical protein